MEKFGDPLQNDFGTLTQNIGLKNRGRHDDVVDVEKKKQWS